jgi:hypothetical protein
MPQKLDSGPQAPIKLRDGWPPNIKPIKIKSSKESLYCKKKVRQLVHSTPDSNEPSTLYLTFGLDVDCYLISNKNDNNFEAENMT